MALLFAEHAVTVYPRVETPHATTKLVSVPTEGAGVALTVQIRPLQNTVIFDAQTGDELRNPYEMKVEPGDVGSVPYGARVVWTAKSLQFRITNKVNRHEADGDLADLNHGSVEMELLEVIV